MHPSRRAPSGVRPSCLVVEALEARDVPSVAVRFDYTYDTAGFFNDPARRAALEHAAAQIAPRLQDSLAPIAPSGGNTWQAQFFNPATNATVTLDNPTVRQDEVVVYIGAAPLGGSELGLTTSGGYTATGTKGWLDAVRGRGQAGALASPKTDVAPWGGMITFDSSARWNAPAAAPNATQYDFESVALHEMMHVFGFGLGEPAFTRNVVGGVFSGPAVVAANGGVAVPATGSPADHFAPGTNWHGQQSPMQASLPPGVRRTLTPLDYAALDDTGWDVAGVAAAAPALPAASFTAASVTSAASPLVAAAVPVSDVKFAVGTANAAVVYGPFGEVIRTIVPFRAGYTAGVRVASADLNGDGTLDLVVATGPGAANAVKVYDGRTGNPVAAFQPFEAGFTGGLNLAAGDVTGDGRADLVVTPDANGGPVVAVYDGAALGRGQVAQVVRFLGLDDPNFRGGLRPALGDVNGDGTPDLALAAGFGGGPRVALLDGRTLAGGGPVKLAGDFFAFETGLRNGAFVAIVDVNGDGYGEVVAGGGPGGAPRVTAFDGRRLLLGAPAPVANFFAGGVEGRGGVRLATADLGPDGRPELLAGVGPQVRAYSASGLAAGSPAPLLTVTTTAALPAIDDTLSVG